ncbi:hypothetical protein NMD14_03025 [Aeromonas veronii]
MSDLFELEPPVDELAETEAGPAHLRAPEPVSSLARAFQLETQVYGHSVDGSREELLSLGAIRGLYWLALAVGEVALARTIGDWWADVAPLHGLGEVIT